MKNQTNKILLLFLVTYGLGFAAVALRFSVNPLQSKTQTKYGSFTASGLSTATNPPQDKTQTKQPTQLGYGRAPRPP